MADIAALKRTTGKSAGPPPEVQAPGNVQNPPRDKKEPIGKIQLSIPESTIGDFEAEAAKRFGFKKGSKSQMFIALWTHYQKTHA